MAQSNRQSGAGRCFAAAAVALTLWPATAAASFCVVEGILVEATPGRDAVAPRNIRVRVRMTLAPSGDTPRGRTRLHSWKRRVENLDAVTISLRAVGPKDKTVGPDLKVTRTVTGMQNERIVELLPQPALAPQQRYRIQIVAGPVRYASDFTTSAASDDAPPTWAGITRAEVAGLRPIPLPGQVVVTSSADRSNPWIVAQAPQAADDATPAEMLVYGIWSADAAGQIDYTRPPLSYLGWNAGRILAGRDEAYPEKSLCDLPMFPFPAKPAESVRIGMRAIDWAGNLSPPSEVTLSLARPLAKRENP